MVNNGGSHQKHLLVNQFMVYYLIIPIINHMVITHYPCYVWSLTHYPYYKLVNPRVSQPVYDPTYQSHGEHGQATSRRPKRSDQPWDFVGSAGIWRSQIYLYIYIYCMYHLYIHIIAYKIYIYIYV